ncbi:hypothetical protein HYV73_04780 [Candidatus Uhrbacteria bacterium]|nr:hypothetical protein [Candidatus Uhrbacteria bacterium]
MMQDQGAQAMLATMRDQTIPRAHLIETSIQFSRALAKRVETLTVYRSAAEQVSKVGRRRANSRRRNTLLVPMLPAGQVLLPGFMTEFPESETISIAVRPEMSSHVPSAAKQPFRDSLGYVGTIIVLCDLIETGETALHVIRLIKEHRGRRIIIACIVGCEVGTARIKKEFPDVEIFLGALDPVLNEQGKVEPGLGPFSDRLFGRQNA